MVVSSINYNGPIRHIYGPAVYIPGQMTYGIVTGEIFKSRLEEAFASTNGRCTVETEHRIRILVCDAGVGVGDFNSETAKVFFDLKIAVIVGVSEGNTPAFTSKFILSATKMGIACVELAPEDFAQFVRMIKLYECDVSFDFGALEATLSNYWHAHLAMNEAHRQALLSGTWAVTDDNPFRQ